MTHADVAEAIDRQPFVPIRLHLLAGATIDLRYAGMAWPLKRALLVLQEGRDRKRTGLYDVIDVRAIERIEQLPI